MSADHDSLCEMSMEPKPRGLLMCRCDLIARVMEREQERARQRVEAARHRGPQDERPEYHYIFATDPAAAAGGDAA